MAHKLYSLILISLCLTAGIIISSCKGKSTGKNIIILTEAPGNIQLPDYKNGTSWRYLPGARIVSVRQDNKGKTRLLTRDFYSACFPEISYDGRSMLFTAQQSENDTWQIWEMNLRNLKSRKITSFAESCTDPVYLPGGRMAFSKLTVNDTVKSAHCLFTCSIDGFGIRQITFSPASSFATTVLRDGRLLTVSTQFEPAMGEPLLTVMRPDGTKADMFYRTKGGNRLLNSPAETDDRKILLIESDETSGKRDIISIAYNRPLHTRYNLTSEIQGDFQFALPLDLVSYLVSCRKSDSESFGLYEFDPGNKILGSLVYSDPAYNVVDAVVAEEYERPKKLPSEVDMHVKTGLLMCQDINVFNTSLPETFYAAHKARKIEVLGIDSTYGVVEVEEDGSFYLKVIADTPFRIRTIDDNGNVLSGPCSWLWLRPNERRGCVGCHEDPELVPENRIPAAVRKSPVIIPVHLKEIKEKSVELE